MFTPCAIILTYSLQPDVKTEKILISVEIYLVYTYIVLYIY